ncbi:MAG: hypothetical protein HYX21_00990 [Candidatus Yanofskybacteria bacterium]|nr:hypothetical protein [Candidatus Yanofskybacteria bacterium]
MAKFIGFTLLIAAVLVVLNREKVENFKQSVIETINPAVKEKRLIGELKNSLEGLDALLSDKSTASKDEKIKKANIAVSNARKTLEELQSTNQKSDLGANLSNLIQKFVPLNSEPSPTWLPPSQCN